jgi:hypothetical protein
VSPNQSLRTEPKLIEADGNKYFQYDDASCPSLATNWPYRVVVVPEDQYSCTSSAMENRWHYEKFVYLKSDGRTIAIPHGAWDKNDPVLAWPVSSNAERHQEYDWIGPASPASEVARGNPPYSGLPWQLNRPLK